MNGPYDPIQLPRVSNALDYEGELGFVIGQRCRHVPSERAHEVIAGYLVVNDVSVRDWQCMAADMTLGKSFDTHGPIGPWIVTPDEVGDPHTLELKTWVNGELRQHSTLSIWSSIAMRRSKPFRPYARCCPGRSFQPAPPRASPSR